MSRDFADRFPGATVLGEIEFVGAIVGHAFRYRLLDDGTVFERPGEFFAEGGRYSTGHRAILHGTYAFDRGVVSIDCPDCRHTFLGLGSERIFFRHQGRLLMANANGEGNVIELIPAS